MGQVCFPSQFVVGAEYTVITKDTDIITLNFHTLFWDCYGNVKALCFKALILRPNPVLAVFWKIRVLISVDVSKYLFSLEDRYQPGMIQ